MAKIQTPGRIRGTQDIFGPEQRRFATVLAAFERVRALYCFQRVDIPVFESTAVFARSLGETTDVVSKEMYTFADRGGDSITLRPEFTAGIARAYLTEGWQQYAPLKLATSGPVFRYERPQKGRFRQFHQIDAEVIGAAEPAADVELLAFADQLLRELWISDGVTLQLNTLGDAETRDAWRAALVEHFQSHRADLSEDSLARLDKNPLRILDSKDPRDRPIADSAPDIDQFLTGAASDFFGAVTAGLDAAGVAWTRNARLVRGLDYYRHTAFEFVTDRLGAQGTVLAGGRYDGLIESLGGASTPGVGWAAGVERLAMLVEEPEVEAPKIAIVVEDDDLLSLGQELVAGFRRANLASEIVATGSVKKRFERAVKLNALAAFAINANLLDDGEVAKARLRVTRSGWALNADQQQAITNAVTAFFDVSGGSHDLAYGREVGLKRKAVP
ncbi:MULTISPECIES: histidine--tRNA ligase [unclassified Sphingomonas]|uniref:histidine--tRNA ligase n=1 Tax=unclassified Sphingomonas TaxID=196159 RepID=UPI000835E8F4|nr:MULTISPECIES: histidine--tRNA ligase [unclassified Sphingomonas]